MSRSGGPCVDVLSFCCEGVEERGWFALALVCLALSPSFCFPPLPCWLEKVTAGAGLCRDESDSCFLWSSVVSVWSSVLSLSPALRPLSGPLSSLSGPLCHISFPRFHSLKLGKLGFLDRESCTNVSHLLPSTQLDVITIKRSRALSEGEV